MSQGLTAGRVLGLVLSGLALTGCSHIPFLNRGGADKVQAQAAKGERLPVLGVNARVEPTAALKGVEFSVPPAQPLAAWPVPGGTPEQAVEHVQAGANFQIAWRRKAGAGQSRGTHVTAPPIVADGRVYVMDGRAAVTAFDEGGRQIWRTDLANRSGKDRDAYGGGIAFGGGTVFVASGYRFVVALDARTGAEKWRTPMSSPVHSAPNVQGGRVYVIDVQDQLTVLDAATGQSVWTYQAIEEPARVLQASSPAVSGDVVVAPFASGEIVALNNANGSELWTDVLSLTNRNNALSEIRDIGGRPVVYRGDVLAGSHSGVLVSIALNTGQRRWALPIFTISSPWPAGDVIYVTDQAGEVICIARDSGQVYWISDLNKDRRKKERAIWSGPILASNRLIVVSDKGEAVALDPKTGARTATLRLGSPAFLSPVAANGTVYVLSRDAELIAIR